jgi:hypothetical protein
LANFLVIISLSVSVAGLAFQRGNPRDAITQSTDVAWLEELVTSGLGGANGRIRGLGVAASD